MTLVRPVWTDDATHFANHDRPNQDCGDPRSVSSDAQHDVDNPIAINKVAVLNQLGAWPGISGKRQQCLLWPELLAPNFISSLHGLSMQRRISAEGCKLTTSR